MIEIYVAKDFLLAREIPAEFYGWNITNMLLFPKGGDLVP